MQPAHYNVIPLKQFIGHYNHFQGKMLQFQSKIYCDILEKFYEC